MTSSDHTIENLMKVSLTLHFPDPSTTDQKEIPFEFIYGIGPSGITPFEKALFGKRTGDRIRFDIAATDFCQAVGHLEHSLREQAGIMAPVCLEATVTGVTRAPDREVVKAMAAGGSCEDCGCGCGGH
jgi:hypothetical protein